MAQGATDASARLNSELGAQSEAAAGPLRSASEAEAEPADAAGEPAPGLVPEPTGPAPDAVSAGPVVPAPLPAERLDYSSDRESTDQAMADAGVSTEQIQRGNEPEFAPALEARSTAETHEASAGPQYRETEAAMRVESRAQAEGRLGVGLTGMRAQRLDLVGQVVGEQESTQTHQSQERRLVTERVAAIKEATRHDVEVILTAMDANAVAIFEVGLREAEGAYEDAFEEAKGGIGNWLTEWGSDWDELIEESLATGRAAYLERVGRAIDEVATLVESQLAAAKQRVTRGRAEVDAYVAGLDEGLQAAGEEARQQVSADFDALESSVDERRDRLVERLTQQYRDSYQRMSETENRLREENKSLWQRVYDATIGVIKKIIEFKNLLFEVLARAASVIMLIIEDPIGFLSNLVQAVTQGVTNFKDHIVEHLKKGLLDWVFGAVARAGIELPATFDLKGILSLVLQILGLTWQNIRRIAVEMVGEPIVHALEMFAEPIIVLVREGPSGLWEWIKEKLTDLKAMLLDEIQGWLITNVIEAGITWVISLLSPASAFLKACKAIYDIVKFFVERARQLADFVKAVTESIGAIARGSLGAAAQRVEDALARAIPVAIGFLASLLGLDDLSGTIERFIQRIRQPIEQAIRWLVGKAVMLVKAAGKLLGIGKDEPTKATGDPEHDSAVAAALADIPAAENAHLEDEKLSHEGAELVVTQIRSDHPVLTQMKVVDRGNHWAYEWAASPGAIKDGSVEKAGDEASFAELNELIAELSTTDEVIDRLSRAREFDIATYRELQGSGGIGRPYDVLESDEIIQNAYWRKLLGVTRWSAELKDNPAVALSPKLHRQIKNLKAPQMAGLTAQQVLDHHLEQMRPFTPPDMLVVLRREGEKYLKSKGK
ncbi:MAG: phage tail protein [Solirubrobacterales bacterium]